MKYIRTKDGIFEIEYSIQTDIGLLVRGKGQKSFTKLCEANQADTIEELCDKLVLISGINRNCNPFLITIETRITGVKEVVFNDGSGHHSIVHHQKQSDEIYGAIWTDEGLIYVAKMNDKGELELL